ELPVHACAATQRLFARSRAREYWLAGDLSRPNGHDPVLPKIRKRAKLNRFGRVTTILRLKTGTEKCLQMDRQKKLMIFGAAWVSALLLSWFFYSHTVAPRQETQAQVVAVVRDLPLGALLRPNDIRLVKYPARDVPKGAISDPR